MSILDPRTIKKCLHRLAKAKEALYRCRSAHSESDFVNSYGEFLIYTGAILHALEAGSKFTPQGMQWYGAKRRFGKNDELLMYMFQARNQEEHDVDDVSELRPGQFQIGGPAIKNPDARTEGISVGGQLLIQFTQGHRSLVPITDKRFKQTFPVPTSHLGKPLNTTDPVKIGEIYAAYLEQLVADAALLS